MNEPKWPLLFLMSFIDSLTGYLQFGQSAGSGKLFTILSREIHQ